MNNLSRTGFAASVFRIGFLVLSLGTGSASQAQIAEDPDWKESVVPPPPAFDFGKLIPFSGSVSSPLVYGVDPASVQISNVDGVVRYVLVATAASGARNVMYEGIRCATGEFRTYARYSSDGRWSMVSNSEWKSMFDNMPSKHALYFAKAGGCDSGSAPPSVSAMANQLKNSNFRFGNN